MAELKLVVKTEADLRELKGAAVEIGNLKASAGGAASGAAEMGRGMDAAKGKTKDVGQAAMAASYALQDFSAAGIGGVVNNLPGLLMGLGAGAGLAAAMQVVGVAADFALKNLDKFGLASDKEAKELQRASRELLSKARAMEAAARGTNAAEAAARAMVDSLAAEADAYAAGRKEIDARLAQRRAEVDAVAEVQAAEAALAAARRAARVASGDLSPEDAARQEAEANMSAAERDYAQKKALREEEATAAEEQARLAMDAAAAIEKRKRELAGASARILDKDTREAMAAKLDADKKGLESLRKKAPEVASKSKSMWNPFVSPEKEDWQQYAQDVIDRAAAMKIDPGKVAKTSETLANDKRAREATGIPDAETRADALKKLEADRKARLTEAAEAAKRAEAARAVQAREDKLQPIRKDTLAIAGQSRVEQEQRRAKEAREAAAEREAAAAKREADKAARASEQGARKDGKKDSAEARELRSLLRAPNAGSGEERLLTAEMVAYVQRQREELARVREEMRKLTGALRDAQSGR